MSLNILERTNYADNVHLCPIPIEQLKKEKEEIAKVVNLTQQQVSNITNISNFTKICKDYTDGKSVDNLAEFYKLDLITLYAIILREKTDQERFSLFVLN